ncbi:MAG: FxLYD domain-containing protein, partial [Lachnospiraceae bacterium]|nr:FxLYD domain-containing protein [Lachnospiraceae bacterium]
GLGAGETPPAEEPPSVPEKVVDYKVNQELFNHYVTTFGSHLAAAFVEIENTGNTPLYLHDGQFDVEDNSGHLLTTQTLVSTCPGALRPGETGYFYSDYIDLSDVDDSNGLVFVPHYKVDEARHEIIDYEVSDLGIREDDMFKCKVSGRLTNTQDEEINLLYVNVIYYDSEGRVLGISGTNITDVQPGDTTSFEVIGKFFYDGVNYSDIAEYKVIPRAWYMQF